MDKALALIIISDTSGTVDNKAVESATKALSSYADTDGFAEEELLCIVNAICNGKLSSSTVSQLIRCLIPAERVSNYLTSKILSWAFTGLGKLGPTVERICFRWFVGLLQYNLCEKDELHKYYHSFFFALDHRHLEVPICMILYYLSQPEDAKKFIVGPLIRRHGVTQFSQLTALLSLLKSYRPELLPANIKQTVLNTPHSSFDAGMRNAVERLQGLEPSVATEKELRWNTFRPTKRSLGKQPRLIPAVDYLRRRTTFGGTSPPFKSMKEFTSMLELGMNQVRVSSPAQTMSLLANDGGFHIIATSSPPVQTRLLYNLEETLLKVILHDRERYSVEEKEFLLVSMAALQEHLQQSVSVVNKFLIKFLLAWDGFDHCKEVHALMEWFSFDTIEEWELVGKVLRVYFRSSELEDRCSMLASLTIMMRNLVSSSVRSQRDMPRLLADNARDVDISSALAAVGSLVSEVLTEGLAWARPEHARRLLSKALDFYHAAAVAEQKGDVPMMIMVPMAVVYQCLFSGSRLCIERLCSLLLTYGSSTRERLYRLAVFEDFQDLLNDYLGAYLLDCYRALFGNLQFLQELNPGIFTGEYLENLKKLNLPPVDGISLTEALRVENSTAWFTVPNNSECVAQIGERSMARHFPATIAVKKFVEDKLASQSL